MIDQNIYELERRIKRLYVIGMVILAMVFVPIAAAMAVTVHDWHVHNHHVRPIEERIEKLECHLGLEPGLDTSELGPFSSPKKNAECHYPGPGPTTTTTTTTTP